MCNYKTEILSDSYVLENYKCNRAIYKNNYCIFHYGLKYNESNEYNEDEVKKKESDFNDALQVYLNDKNLKEYDFIGWLFPKLNFNNFKLSDQNNFVFNLPVKFIKTIFLNGVNFCNAKFVQGGSFKEAQFIQGASFYEAEFVQGANFNEAQFIQGASFNKAQFVQGANFYNAKFLADANFINVKFKSGADFIEVKFEGVTYFNEAKFDDGSRFNKSIFAGDVYFYDTEFNGCTDFEKSKFDGVANFEQSSFAKEAYFGYTKFECRANFLNVFFLDKADFNNSIFAKEVHFDKTIFLNKFVLNYVYCKENIYINNCFLQSINLEVFKSDSFFIVSNSCIENIVIQNSIFQKINFNNVLSNSINDDLKKIFKKNDIEIKNDSTEKNEWNFSGQDLSNFSFIECDFSVANFLSANIQKAHIDNCIFPTDIVSCIFSKDKVGRKKLFNHNTNADDIKLQFTYQRFKRQFTENHYYQLAQDFHFQEMNLRKKYKDKFILYLYNLISEYGTNYLRPLIILLILINVYPIILLYKTWDFNCHNINCELYSNTKITLFKLIAPLKLIHENDKDFTYIYKNYINTNCGIFLVLIFYIIVTILITMFLQALSRNFKR